jgi:hypothetical protein
VQRLFSMFPRSAPGVGLALLRVSVAASLWTTGPLACVHEFRFWFGLGFVLLGLAVCIGVLTPIAATTCAVVNGVGVVCAGHEATVFSLGAVLPAAALALMGPGAYSLDAWMFGRRVVVVSCHESHAKE